MTAMAYVNHLALRAVAALMLLLTLAGCGKGGPKANPGHPLPPSPRVVQGDPGHPGGRFALSLPSAPRTFNPLFALDSASDDVVRLLFSTLVSLNFVNHEVGP